MPAGSSGSDWSGRFSHGGQELPSLTLSERLNWGYETVRSPSSDDAHPPWPQVLDYLDYVLRAGALIGRGGVHIADNWRGVVVTGTWRLDGTFGGYERHPFEAGGRDRWIRCMEEQRVE